MRDLPCAPKSILKLIKCLCVKSRCSAHVNVIRVSFFALKCVSGDKTSCDNIYPCKDDSDISENEDGEMDD